jgi:hypothetical protein
MSLPTGAQYHRHRGGRALEMPYVWYGGDASLREWQGMGVLYRNRNQLFNHILNIYVGRYRKKSLAALT